MARGTMLTVLNPVDPRMRIPQRFTQLVLLATIPTLAQAEVELDLGGVDGTYEVTAGESLDLDASASDVSDCSLSYYMWTMESVDGSHDTEETPFSTSPTASIDLADVDGPANFALTLTIRCRVVDDKDDGAVTEDYSKLGKVQVDNADPSFEDVEYGSPVYEGDTVEFLAIVSDPEPADELYVSWYFQDGILLEGESISRTFGDDDLIDLEIMVEDDDGGKESRSLQFEINNLDPEISCTYEPVTRVGEMWHLRPEATDPGDDELLWDVDPLPATAWFDSYTGEMDWEPSQDEVGLHTLTLTVEDEDGGSDSLEIAVDVRPEEDVQDSGTGIDGGEDGSNRDSAVRDHGADIMPGSESEIIGCSCSTGSRVQGWLWLIFMTTCACLRRCH